MLEIFSYHLPTQTTEANIAPERLPALLADEQTYLWADFEQPTLEEIELLSQVFKLDPLAIEDCRHPHQFPKLENFEDTIFWIVKSVVFSQQADQAEQHFTAIELDGFLGDRYLITYHEEPLKAIIQAKAHFKRQTSRLKQGTAYLSYQILDELIDQTTHTLDYFDEQLATTQTLLQDKVFNRREAMRYQRLSRQILDVRRMSVKNREVFYQLSHSPLPFIDPEEARLFRDIYDHVVRVVDMTEYYQQTLHSMLDIHLSLNAHRVNQVVQFLTIIATVVLPLNVITGFYGMNFDYLPMLHHPYGVWVVLLAMLILMATMLYSFKRRGWL